MPTITNADIVGRLKLLADYHLKADSGSTTTAVSALLIDEPTLANAYICFINGDNIGIDRVVTSFLSESGRCTFDAVTSAVTSTDEFCITRKGFLSDIAQARIVISNDFRNMGYDIDLFLTTAQLKELYIYKTIQLICGGLMNDGDDQDIYFVNYERFKELYDLEKAFIAADYDADESGTITDDEEGVSANYGVLQR